MGFFGPRQTCVDCHFLVKAKASAPDDPVPATAEERGYAKTDRWGWLKTPPATLGCYRGVWSETHGDVPDRFRQVVKTDHAGSCFFLPYREGLSLGAAAELEKRQPRAGRGSGRSLALTAAVLAAGGAFVLPPCPRPAPQTPDAPAPTLEMPAGRPQTRPAPTTIEESASDCGMNTTQGSTGTSASFRGPMTKVGCARECREWLCQPKNSMRWYHSRCLWGGTVVEKYAPSAAMPAELPPEIIERYPHGCWSIVAGGGTGPGHDVSETECRGQCRVLLAMNEASYEAHDWACVYEGRVIDSRPAPKPAGLEPALPGESDPRCGP